MGTRVYCGYGDCIHNGDTRCRRESIVHAEHHQNHCDEYKKRKCQHIFKCSKCGEEVNK